MWRWFLTIVTAALVMGVTAAYAEKKPGRGKEGKSVKTKLTTEQFGERIQKGGGRVDFIFEDDRPFKSCHASTVVEAEDGSLVCAWFGGTAEKDPDVGIWMSRFSSGKWSSVQVAAKVNQTAHWNPALFRDSSTRDPNKNGVFLYFKVGVDVPQWQTYWMRSQDNGLTWSRPVELVPGDVGGRGPVKNKPIVLSDGGWLAPASTEVKGWKPFADRSDDGGKTWQRSADFVIDRNTTRCSGAIQPTLWESPPGTVHALLRTACGVILRTDSHDGGKTWDPCSRTDLPNNNSGIDALRLDDGRVLLVYNPVGRNWGKRTPLTLAVSKDDGKSWKNLVHLETAPGEYSYPAIVRTKSGVAISYTWKRERIRCWQVPLEAIGG
jgi:predicted neuraminidase